MDDRPVPPSNDFFFLASLNPYTSSRVWSLSPLGLHCTIGAAYLPPSPPDILREFWPDDRWILTPTVRKVSSGIPGVALAWVRYRAIRFPVTSMGFFHAELFTLEGGQ